MAGHGVVKPVLDIDAAYAAGLIDGEGCIFIGRTHHRRDNRIAHYLQLKVSMIDKEPLDWLQETFCTQCVVAKESRKSKGWNDIWTWRATGRTAENILKHLLPFLKVKRAEAKLALAFRSLISKPGRKLSDDNFGAREKAWKDMKEIKHSYKVRKVGNLA